MLAVKLCLGYLLASGRMQISVTCEAFLPLPWCPSSLALASPHHHSESPTLGSCGAVCLHPAARGLPRSFPGTYSSIDGEIHCLLLHFLVLHIQLSHYRLRKTVPVPSQAGLGACQGCGLHNPGGYRLPCILGSPSSFSSNLSVPPCT